MNRIGRTSVVGILALGLGGSALAQGVAPAEQYRIRVAYGRWKPSLDAQLQKGADDEPGTLLDVHDDLGIADEKMYEIRATIQLAPGNKLHGGYTPLDYRGDLPAPRTFRFGGSTYSRSERVLTTLKGGYYTAAYELDLVKNPGGFFGVLLGAKVLDFDSVLVDVDQGTREQQTETVLIPVLGAAARIYVGRVSFSGDISGFTIGARGHLYELHGSAAVHVSDRLAIGGGYRLLKVHGKKDLDLIDLRMGGWQFGVELSL